MEMRVERCSKNAWKAHIIREDHIWPSRHFMGIVVCSWWVQLCQYLAWEPCWSHTTNLGVGNLLWMISLASSWGACNSWANAQCSGMPCTSLTPMLRPVKSAFFGSWLSVPNKSFHSLVCLSHCISLKAPPWISIHVSNSWWSQQNCDHFYWIHWNLSVH